MADDTTSVRSLSSDFYRGLRELLEREDLSWVEDLKASDLDVVLLAYRDAVVTAGLDRFGQELRELSRRLVGRGVPCPVCGEPMTSNRDEDHGWETSVGVLHSTRDYLECRAHKVRFFPLDAHLKLSKVGRATPLWANALSQLGVELPYEPAQRLLEALTKRKSSAKTIDAQVQRDGKTLHEIELEEARRLWPNDEKGYARVLDPTLIRSVVEGAILRTPATGRALVLQGDGAMINLAAEEEVKKERQKAKRVRRPKAGKSTSEKEPDPDQNQEGSPFRESIQLLIYRLDDVVRKCRGKYGKKKKGRTGQYRRDRTIITTKQTACVVNDPVLVAMQINRLAHLWGFESYGVRIFVADGGPKLWEFAKEYFRFTVGILDINHARSHIHDCGKELYRDDRKKAKEWGQASAKRILNEGAGPLLVHLKKLAQEPWDEEQARVLKNLIEYVQTHADHMKYPEFVAKGYPIASGAIEGANKHILISRCRRAGQQFKKANAQHLLTLRTALVDGRFEQAMERVRERQAYPEVPSPPQEKATIVQTQSSADRPTKQPPKSRPSTPSPALATVTPEETAPRPATSAIDRFIPWRKQVQLRMAGLGHLIDGVPAKPGEVVQP